MNNKYQHLFFDLDHTLWDFDKNSNETIIELFEEGGLIKETGSTAREFLAKYRAINADLWVLYREGGITKEKLRIKRFIDAFAHFEFTDQQRIAQFERDYLATAPRKTALMEGASEIMEYLGGHYQLHIITNGFAETQRLKMQVSGLQPHFDLIMSSDELKVNKPAAKIFIECMRRVGARRQDSIMIGDNLIADIQGAKNVGMDQVYYNPHRQIHTEKPTFEINHLLELRDLL